VAGVETNAMAEDAAIITEDQIREAFHDNSHISVRHAVPPTSTLSNRCCVEFNA
jgi:hypothetical protein